MTKNDMDRGFYFGIILGVAAIAVLFLASQSCNQRAEAAPPNPTLAPAPPVVCVATDAASWRQAVQLSWSRDVSIHLHGMLPYTGNEWDYRIGRATGTVEIVGGVIDFAEHAPAFPRAENGLTLVGARVTLRGVTVRGFNGHGSAVRADVSDMLEVYDCTLSDIGTRVLTTDPTKPGLTNGLGCFSMPRRIVVMGCMFNRVSLNDEQLAHVLYVQARGEIVCTGNRYYGCGSVWGCYSPRTVITGEYVDAGGTPDVWDRKRRELVHPWALVHNGGRLTFTNNTIAGTFDHVFHGRLPAGAVIAGNTYRCEAKYWFFQWDAASPERSLEWWREAGFDR